MQNKLINPIILIIMICAPAFSWTMTPEFAKEIAQKQAAVSANPKDPDAHFDLAITYAYTNKVQEGLDMLKETQGLCGDVPAYARKLIERYYAVVQKNPGDWRARFRLAFAYYFGGYKKYSIAEFFNIASIDPRNPWPYGYVAVICGEENRWKEAVGYMKRAIAIDSNVAAFHLGMALGYSKIGNPIASVFEGGEALRLKALGY
jgi:tetratricopeptide (TPR) repeat protein